MLNYIFFIKVCPILPTTKVVGLSDSLVNLLEVSS